MDAETLYPSQDASNGPQYATFVSFGTEFVKNVNAADELWCHNTPQSKRRKSVAFQRNNSIKLPEPIIGQGEIPPRSILRTLEAP
ncbi:hypothetical protein NPIL_177701 [Nephila pilipes]|uniref:Uncharacterized protein n=1 Tax=Nephila pilipes TaxID=299642 RepID=A0A8X6NVU5_NEPPI|nr:hypothetical protein NPIL_177701 [Nephila pilipes]